ncbi:uncharacterized protein TNCV_2710241 [Trichonephila clavipes]|nr:uncharacterized protein TNCV_2710241 [Trichonephila clavipes]
MRGRIIGKIEERAKITDVAREFDIAHSVVSRLWKSFKTTGMCSRRHGGGRVRSTTPAEDRYIVLSAKRNRRTTAQQKISRKRTDIRHAVSWCEPASCSKAARAYMWLRMNGTMTGQRYIDEFLLPHVRLFRGAVGDKFVFMDDNATCHRTLAVQDCLDSEGRQVAGRNYPPTNKNTLIRALTEEWDKLPQQLLDNVVQSMVRRVECCITLHGGHILY